MNNLMLKICNETLGTSFNSCADLYIKNKSDNFIFFDNLIEVALNNNEPYYVENKLTNKDGFSYTNKKFFSNYVLDLPFDVILKPIDNFISIISGYIDEGYALRLSNKTKCVVIINSIDKCNLKLIGKMYRQFKSTKIINIKFNEILKFIKDNCLEEKMYFIKKNNNNVNVSALRIKIQLEFYLHKEKDQSYGHYLSIDAFQKMNYKNKNNLSFLKTHKILMLNRFDHLINFKAMFLDNNTKEVYNLYIKYVEELLNKTCNTIQHNFVVKLIELEKTIIEYIISFYNQ